MDHCSEHIGYAEMKSHHCNCSPQRTKVMSAPEKPCLGNCHGTIWNFRSCPPYLRHGQPKCSQSVAESMLTRLGMCEALLLYILQVSNRDNPSPDICRSVTNNTLEDAVRLSRSCCRDSACAISARSKDAWAFYEKGRPQGGVDNGLKRQPTGLAYLMRG